jgi:tetratricopeptide (TPR) repeat protein
MRGARSALLAALLAAGVPAALVSQTADVAAALELERQSRPLDAADRFMAVLQRDPAHAVALVGLERTLQAGGAVERIFPYLERAVAAAPNEPLAREIELRVLANLGRDGDLTAAAERWIAVRPAAPEPYREWSFLVAQRGDLVRARQILERGHARVGGWALAPELAQLAVASGQWVEAARSWYAAAAGSGSYANAAGLSLGQVRPDQRAAVLQLLLGELGDPLARRIAADALLAWGRAGEAWSLLDANLPPAPIEAAAALRRFADRARLVPGVEGARVRGHAYQRLAGFVSGPAVQRARIDAARAFAEAGDRAAAERVLGDIARDPSTAPPGTADAMSALIGLLADAGRPADAERRLADWGQAIPESDREDLRRRIAWAWARAGALGRADSALGTDSTVGAVALRGWVALFRGDLGLAVDRFRDAGPFAGSREEATRRTAAAALAQRLGRAQAPDVGGALLLAVQGDTVRAIAQLERAAGGFAPAGGRADLLAWAGQLALESADPRAAPLLHAALAADSVGPTAPAAELGLAELAWRGGRPDEARRRLERVILDYPASAVVPQARRLLDRVRGAVPNS